MKAFVWTKPGFYAGGVLIVVAETLEAAKLQAIEDLRQHVEDVVYPRTVTALEQWNMTTRMTSWPDEKNRPALAKPATKEEFLKWELYWLESYLETTPEVHDLPFSFFQREAE